MAHPVLRHRHFFEGRPAVPGGPKDLAWFAPDGSEVNEDLWWSPGLQTVGMYLAGGALRSRTSRGEPITDDSFLLLLHGGEDEAEFVLPATPWAVRYERLLDTADERPHPADWSDSPGDVVVLGARSLVLLKAEQGTS
jgi:glycogen operon protein